MPHLLLCNRYFRISSDEFPLPIGLGLIVRLGWAALLSIVLDKGIVDRQGTCNYGLISYLSASLTVCALIFIVAAVTITKGLRGTIADGRERESIKPYLLAYSALLVCELICACVGATVFSNRFFLVNCEDETSSVALVMISIVVIMQVANSAITSCCCYTTYLRTVDDHFIGSMKEDRDAETIWATRLNRGFKCVRCCSCTVAGGSDVKEDDIESVAKLLTMFFHHDGFLDLVPGDVFAGILLVKLQQESLLQYQISRKSISINQVVLEGLDLDKDSTDNTDAADSPKRDNQVKLEITAADLDLYPVDASLEETEEDHRMRAITPRSVRRGSNFMLESDFLEGHDRGVYANDAKMKKRELVIDNADDSALVVDISYYMPYALSSYSIFMAIMYPCSCMCRTCFSCLANSRKHQAGGVEGDSCCVHRATSQHILSNMNCDLVYGNYENTVLLSPYCIFLDHDKNTVVLSIRGTMSIEDAVLDLKLNQEDISATLRRYGVECHDETYSHGGFMESALHILEHIESQCTLQRLLDEDSERKLVIVGHSLGGGLAALLTMILKARYHHTRGLCYAPPAVTIDQVAAHDCRDYLTSVVYGDDCVSSLNYSALTHLRERVLDSLARAKVNKNYILQTMYKKFPESTLLYKPDEVPESHNEFISNMKKFKEQVHSKKKGDKAPQLTLPGRIIHFEHNKNNKPSCCGKSKATPYEVHQDAFLELKISPTMLTDHMVSEYYWGLNQYCTDWN
jgi:sn1-specific diacylglycerol lipase